MATLEVLCQNGRREKVKVQPGTPLLEVIDEVCTKQGLEPSRHRLIHNRKQLDSTIQFRYSGLLNNAKLELIETDVVNDNAQVALALQLADGTRLVDNFAVQSTLLDVLTHFQATSGQILNAPQNISGVVQHPSCIYAQSEVCGIVALKATNLRNLGLTGGRAVLRFGWKELSREQLADIEHEITARHEKARKLEERRTKVLAAAAEPSAPAMMETTEEPVIPAHQEQSIPAPPSIPAPVDQPHFRSVFDDGPVVSAFGGQARERSMFNHDEPARTKPQPVEVRSVFGANDNAVQPFGQFANFKFPDATKGQELYKNEMAPANVGEFTKPCDREAVLYQIAEATIAQEPEEELPEDFYDITKEDLQVMHQDLQRQTDFSIASQAARRYERYERAVVRIHFPADGLVLQAVFRPTEPVFALYKFIRQQLNAESENNFILYTPPRRILSESDMAETFSSAGLLPAVNIYASSKKSGGSVHVTHEARSKLLNGFEAARSVVAKWVTAANSSSDSQMEAAAVSMPAAPHKASPTEGASIRPPKWFKLK